MSVLEICTRNVVTVDPSADLVEAAQIMRSEHVGDLIVTREAGGQTVPVGILTDRDIVLEVVASSVDPRAITVSDAMTPRPFMLRSDQDIHYALQEMRHNGIRRAPIVDASGVMQGVLSIDDAIDHVAGLLGDIAGAIASGRDNEATDRP